MRISEKPTSHLKADVVVMKNSDKNPNKTNVKKVYDFKFNCPKMKDGEVVKEAKGEMSKEQMRKYKKTLGKAPAIIHKSW